MLCALARRDSKLYIVPTRYTLPTDNIPIVSVCGLPDGRIFMGGYDGSLYEFDYEIMVSHGPPPPKTQEQRLNDYYDGTASSIQMKDFGHASQVLSKGKRAFVSLLGGSERRQKCRKLNHSANGVSAVASAIVPDWLRKAPAALFGATSIGPLEKIVHDAERQCLYTLTCRGFVSVYDLRLKEITVKASIDCENVARQYLSAVAKGHMYAPSPSIEFVGGGASAQAGVGGMEGARSILKLADTNVKAKILTPISLHVLPRSDSSRLTVLAVTGGGLRYYLTSLSSNLNKSNLAPSSKIILCSIRAPPPVDPATGIIKESFDEREVPGGIIPSLLPHSSVDSTSYADGHLFLALQNPQQQSVGTTDAEVGNTIVSTNADFVHRKVIKKDNRMIRELPGGITETVSLPAKILPGGRIIDSVAIGYTRNSPLLKLLFNSQTPSDSELSVGLVPPYYPSVVANNAREKKQGNQQASTSSMNYVQSAAMVKTTTLNRPKSSIALQVLSNFLLSRPLGYGISFRSALPASTNTSQGQLYRLSNRYGSQGFSSTAGGIVNNNVTVGSTNNHKSSRLSPWLLNPPMVPLNELTMNHILPSTRTVALSVGGLHFFKSSTILQRLAEKLMTAGPNIARDGHVMEFVNNYGPKEFCNLCFMLAIGCGPARGSGTEAEELKSRAYKAAFGSGGEPRLIRKAVIGDSRDSFVVQDVSADPLVPSGYDFAPSFLSEAVVLVSSRLLRPIWYKPAVVVTEGHTLKLAGSSTKKFPAKVELLLDDATLESVRAPLFTLMQLMQQLFRRAIEVVPGVRTTDSNQMDIDESSVLTGSMRFQGTLRLIGMATDFLSIEDAIATARLIEERNIHSMYRLISRSVQFLDLLSLLKRAHFMPDLPEVEWGLLHGLTMSQLVQSRDGQERVETLLNSLVSNTKVIDASNLIPCADSDQIARSLTNNCFLYFSPGAGLAYLGFRAANEALLCMQKSAKRSSLSKQAVQHFKKAATFWNSAQLISGRLMHSGEVESYDEKVNLAFRYDSPLARASAVLLKIGEYVAIVDICNMTAANFRDTTEAGARTLVTVQASCFPWEKTLYHNKISQEESTNVSSETISSSTAIVVGSSVTAQDAISTCHAIILHHLLLVLNSPIPDDDKFMMISACAASPYKDFQKVFFEFLVNTKNESMLVKIDSPSVENWLDGIEDPHLKWQYYVAQRKHADAGELMWKLATGVHQTHSLDDRVIFLERSQSSYNSAIINPATQMASLDLAELENKTIRAGEHLDIARLQQRTLKTITSLGLEAQLGEAKMQKLKMTLLDVSDLYNDYAAELELHDVCLHILRSCRHDEAGTIELLWQRIIMEEICPCSTRSEAAFNFLLNFVANDTNMVVFLAADRQECRHPLFESGVWVENVKRVLIGLGNELFGKGSEFIIPVEFLVTTLEGEFGNPLMS
jgi:nuclear pore complex protein Nup155